MGLAFVRQQGHLGRAASKTVVTDFSRHQAAVANIIPPQKAGRVADLAQVADRSGWCPVDAMTFDRSSSRTSM
jgi:hypothetical protein